MGSLQSRLSQKGNKLDLEVKLLRAALELSGKQINSPSWSYKYLILYAALLSKCTLQNTTAGKLLSFRHFTPSEMFSFLATLRWCKLFLMFIDLFPFKTIFFVLIISSNYHFIYNYAYFSSNILMPSLSEIAVWNSIKPRILLINILKEVLGLLCNF